MRLFTDISDPLFWHRLFLKIEEIIIDSLNPMQIFEYFRVQPFYHWHLADLRIFPFMCYTESLTTFKNVLIPHLKRTFWWKYGGSNLLEANTHRSLFRGIHRVPSLIWPISLSRHSLVLILTFCFRLKILSKIIKF